MSFADMLRAVAVIGIALFAQACTDSNANTDLGVVEPGCRAPSACWKVGTDCDCERGLVVENVADTDMAGTTSCRECDPTHDTCYCPLTTQCIDGDSVCTGRATSTCLGAGARCVPVHSTCGNASGSPPQLVGTGPNGALEPRCQYVDDICCPGMLDMAKPDLGVPPDLSVPDLSEVD
jgi:hypothetical protein